MPVAAAAALMAALAAARDPFYQVEGARGLAAGRDNAWKFTLTATGGVGRAAQRFRWGELEPQVRVAVVHDELQYFATHPAGRDGAGFRVEGVRVPRTGWYDLHYHFAPLFSSSLLATALLYRHDADLDGVLRGAERDALQADFAKAEVTMLLSDPVTFQALNDGLRSGAQALWSLYQDTLTVGATERVYVGAVESAGATQYAPAAAMERYAVPSEAHRAWLHTCKKCEAADGFAAAEQEPSKYSAEISVAPPRCGGLVAVAFTLRKELNGRGVITRMLPAPDAPGVPGLVLVRSSKGASPTWQVPAHVHSAAAPESLPCDALRGLAAAPSDAESYPGFFTVYTAADFAALSALVVRVTDAKSGELVTVLAPIPPALEDGVPSVLHVAPAHAGTTRDNPEAGVAYTAPPFAPLPSCCPQGWTSVGAGTCVKVSDAIGRGDDAAVCEQIGGVLSRVMHERFELAVEVVQSHQGTSESVAQVHYGAVRGSTDFVLPRYDAAAVAAAGLDSAPVDPLVPMGTDVPLAFPVARGGGDCSQIAFDGVPKATAVACSTPLPHLCLRRCAQPTPFRTPSPKPPKAKMVDDRATSSNGGGGAMLVVVGVACTLVVLLLVMFYARRRCRRRDEDAGYAKPAQAKANGGGDGFTIPDEGMEFSDDDCGEMHDVQEQVGQALQDLPGAGGARPQFHFDSGIPMAS